MALSNLVDLVKIQILSVGVGALQLGPALASFRGQEALIDGGPYSYSIQQGSNYEIGQGTFSAGAATLTRGVTISSYGNVPISLSPNAICTITVLAVDLRVPGPPGNPGNPGGLGLPGNTGLPGTVIYSGAIDPTAAIGVLGDFYINLTSSVFFGPRTSSAWPTGTSLIGPSGTSPVYATQAEARAGAVSVKAIAPDVLHSLQAVVAQTDGATVTWDLTLGVNAKVTIAGNRTLALTNPHEGLTYTLQVIQDATGSRTMTWPASFNWGTTGAPTLTTTASKIDLITFICIDAATPKFLAFTSGKGF